MKRIIAISLMLLALGWIMSRALPALASEPGPTSATLIPSSTDQATIVPVWRGYYSGWYGTYYRGPRAFGYYPYSYGYYSPGYYAPRYYAPPVYAPRYYSYYGAYPYYYAPAPGFSFGVAF